ncbi:hypothetical protein C8P68_102898 [Mucilaginibacter yixingensis]|uniref:Uncharacterized protein n=1 Tax=Mucilaginibacter yixingensis TaxID=1295612 RepID=A0A2T5JE66_9SPHI|nr:hypothetical protein [Mucilaginibacter yixingensis]PTR00067.1 hypothetical protein C8P68_102898 [Mucilaginibacter yixingensis]
MEPEELLNNGENKKGDSPLASLEVDLRLYSESLKEVAIEIIVEGLSRYPIFVAHQHDVKLGEMILDKEELNTDWTIHASTLEEFEERGIINKMLKQRFVDSYKDPHKYMCVFVIVPEGANFVYFPYVKE